MIQAKLTGLGSSPIKGPATASHAESTTAHCSHSHATPWVWKIPECMDIFSPVLLPLILNIHLFCFLRYQLKYPLRENWHPTYLGLHDLEYNHHFLPFLPLTLTHPQINTHLFIPDTLLSPGPPPVVSKRQEILYFVQLPFWWEIKI